MNKNNTVLFSVVFGILGILIGGFVFGSRTYAPRGHMVDEGYMMQAMTGGLHGMTGDAFDKAFLEHMIVHHEGAVVMAEQVLETSKRPELIQLARDIISAQTSEIQMMEKWKSEWFRE